MRVITGTARGMRLKELPGLETRPTTDKVKESLFNIIQFEIEGRSVLDLFGGTGQLGIEALSRGAERCTFVDARREAAALIRENLKATGLEKAGRVVQGDAISFLSGCRERFGVIFLDPPYQTQLLEQTLELLTGQFTNEVMSELTYRVDVLGEDVDLKKIALATAGTVGADLANLVNEAALRAVRHGRRVVTQEDLLASFEFVIAGSEKKNSVLTEFEKKLVAYHEVGHAMVAYKQKNAEPVQKITIVPHTEGSLGYTLLMPEEDKTNLRTKEELMAKITVSMGGRAAEQVVLNTMTNGASQDIQEATNLARNMVAMFGMSDEFGMMALASRRNQYLDGGYGMDCAQDTAARMDQAVKDILDQCYQQAVEVIKASREDMDKVVAYLLEKETITGAEMVAIIEGRDPELVENPYASTRAEDKAFRPSSPETIEAPAKKVHMISQKIESPEEPAQEGQPENPVSDPSPSGGDAPQESGSTPSEPPKDTP